MYKLKMNDQQLVDASFAELQRQVSELIIRAKKGYKSRVELRAKLQESGVMKIVNKAEKGWLPVVLTAEPLPTHGTVGRNGDILVGFITLDNESDAHFDLSIGETVVAQHSPIPIGDVCIAIPSGSDSGGGQIVPLISLRYHEVKVNVTGGGKRLPWLLYALLDSQERRVVAQNALVGMFGTEQKLWYSSGMLTHPIGNEDKRPRIILPEINTEPKLAPSPCAITNNTSSKITILHNFIDDATIARILTSIDYNQSVRLVYNELLVDSVNEALSRMCSEWRLAPGHYKEDGKVAALGNAALGPHHCHQDGSLLGGEATLVVFLHDDGSNHNLKFCEGGQVVQAARGRAVLFDIDLLHQSCVTNGLNCVAPVATFELVKRNQAFSPLYYEGVIGLDADPLYKMFREFDEQVHHRMFNPILHKQPDLEKMHAAFSMYAAIRKDMFSLLGDLNNSYFCSKKGE